MLAPIKQFIDITIANLVPDTPEVQAEIEASIQAMLFEMAAPGPDDLSRRGSPTRS